MLASSDKNKNMRHDRVMRSFQARTLSLKRPRANMDFVHVACRRVRARRKKLKTRTATRLQTPRGNTLTWDDSASRMRPPSDSKSPRPVSRRGLCYSCDDEDMPVICPTCQILKVSVTM